MATEVAPGVHRLGNELVNYYLIEADGGLTLVDAGLPGFLGQLEAFLRERGRTVADIDALLLTHAHGDHVGIAEDVRKAGVPVHDPRARRRAGAHREVAPARGQHAAVLPPPRDLAAARDGRSDRRR